MSLVSQISTLQGNVTTIFSRLDLQDVTLAELQANMTALTTTVNLHTVQISELQGNMTQLESRMSAQEAQTQFLVSHSFLSSSSFSVSYLSE